MIPREIVEEMLELIEGYPILARIFHVALEKSVPLFHDSSKKLSWKGLKTFPTRPCLATRKTFLSDFSKDLREISGLGG